MSIDHVTGEEDEVPILDRDAKLYQFNVDDNIWNVRAVGFVKILKHRVTHKVRLVMRESQTLKLRANHFITPPMSIQKLAGADKGKACMWSATDFADGELKCQVFCISFPTTDDCQSFLDTFQQVLASQQGKE